MRLEIDNRCYFGEEYIYWFVHVIKRVLFINYIQYFTILYIFGNNFHRRILWDTKFLLDIDHVKMIII